MSRYAAQSSIVYVLLLTAGLVGCSRELSRSRAADLINHHEKFSAVMDIKVPVGNFWYGNVNDGDLKTLQDRGILALRESGQKNAVGSKEYLAELTPHGKDASQSWVLTKEKVPNAGFFVESRCWTVFGTGGEPCHEPNGVVYSIVLARRKINEVTGITTDPGGKESAAEFNWEWVPTTDAKIFADRIPAGVQNGQAAFQLYDDGWRITQVALNK